MVAVAFVTLLLVMQFMFFMIMVGKAREAGGVKAPAMTGDENFERNVRVHQNTMEQLMICLPAMWVCGYYYSSTFAATMGLVFLVSRFIYRAAYITDPDKRGTGIMIGTLATVAMILGGLWGLI